MTLEEIKSVLEQTGYPVAYYEFNANPSFPCLVYKEDERDAIIADDSLVDQLKNIRIELYTAKYKNIDAERAVEAVLDNNNILYHFADVGKIKEESLYEVIYEIQI